MAFQLGCLDGNEKCISLHCGDTTLMQRHRQGVRLEKKKEKEIRWSRCVGVLVFSLGGIRTLGLLQGSALICSERSF